MGRPSFYLLLKKLELRQIDFVQLYSREGKLANVSLKLHTYHAILPKKERFVGKGPTRRTMKRVTKNPLTKTRSAGEESSGEGHLRRVRRICAVLPQTEERLSHGEPTFFVGGKVYAMFANNHHADGHVAVWIPVLPGLQATLLKTEPDKFFMPPYVGVRGWVGVELGAVSDEELAAYILES